MTPNLTQLKVSEIKATRERILNDQQGLCQSCGVTISESTGVSLDHQHKTLSETVGVDGAGLVRGVLCRACNVWEGKLWNSTSRYLQPKCVNDRIKALENIINYYRRGCTEFVHPSEAPKTPQVSKRNYNKAKRMHELSPKSRAKFPPFPKSKKLTKSLKIAFELYGVSPWNSPI